MNDILYTCNHFCSKCPEKCSHASPHKRVIVDSSLLSSKSIFCTDEGYCDHAHKDVKCIPVRE